MTGRWQLKEHCDVVCQNPSSVNIAILRKAIENAAPFALQDMQDIVLLPLVNQLDANAQLSADQRALLLDTIHAILERCRICKLTPFRVLLLIVCKQIFDANTLAIRPAATEELKLAAIRCVERAFRALTSDALLELYASTEALLGQPVFVAVQLIEADAYRRIRSEALRLLQTLLYAHADADPSDAELRQHVAERVFSMMPKVCKVLLHVIDGDVKEPLGMKVEAMHTLGAYLAVVFEDYDRQDAAAFGADGAAAPDADAFVRLFARSMKCKEDGASAAASHDDSDAILNLNRRQRPPATNSSAETTPTAPQRTQAWLVAAARRMHGVFERLLVHTANENRDIRAKLAGLVCSLFRLPASAVQQHFEPLWRCLIVLARDEDADIAAQCQRQLVAVQRHPLDAPFYADHMDTLLQRLLLSAPRVLVTGTPAEKCAQLQLFGGVVSAARLRALLAVGDAMERFGTVLVFMVELTGSGEADGDGGGAAVEALRESHEMALQALEAESVDAAERLAVALPTGQRYKRLQTQRERRLAEDLCRRVGRSAAGEAVFGHMLERLRRRTASSDEALLVMQLMVGGEGWGEVSRCGQLMDELMAGAEHWDLDVRPTQTDAQTTSSFNGTERPSDWYEDRTPGLYVSAITVRYTDVTFQPHDDERSSAEARQRLTIAEAAQNVQHLCLTLDAIGTMALNLKRLYQPYLLPSLYRILCKAASRNVRIRAAGRRALRRIASAFEHRDVAALLAENFDYILYAVQMALRRNGRDCVAALEMLAVLLQYSEVDALSAQWQSIVETVLEASGRPEWRTSVGEDGEQKVLSFLLLFRNLLEHMNGKEKSVGEERVTENGPDADVKQRDENTIRNEWLQLLDAEPDHMADNETDEGYIDPSTLPTAEDPATTEEPTTPATSIPVQITERLMKRSIHYMPHKSRAVQCAALDTLGCGFRILQRAGAGDVLLPLVHTMWRPFVERVRAGDAVVVRRCFAVMLVMSGAARDFMYKRTATDIFPLVLAFLKQSAAESLERVRDSSFENTQTHRLTVELFAQMPPLLQHLSTCAESDLDGLLNAIVVFLHRQRHRATLQRSAGACLRDIARTHDAAAVFVKLTQLRHNEATAANVQWVLSGIGCAFPNK